MITGVLPVGGGAINPKTPVSRSEPTLDRRVDRRPVTAAHSLTGACRDQPHRVAFWTGGRMPPCPRRVAAGRLAWVGL